MALVKTISQIKPDLRQRRKHLKICSHINELRTNNNFTIREISAQTGIPIATLYRIEKNPYSCKISQALVLAKFYEKTVEELFG